MSVAETVERNIAAATRPYDVEKVRRDFPILSLKVHGKPLVYLDNAATSQKPQAVIDRLVHYYSAENANIHRGVHYLSQLATEEYDKVREQVKKLINARETAEVIFLRGCTEGINLVASTFGEQNVGKGDEVLITALEHHSNIVPWQMLCERKGAHLKVIPISDEGEVISEQFEKMLNSRVKLLAITHVSNALGTILPIEEMIESAHKQGIPVLIDGAQAAPHIMVDVQALDCDFYAMSGHKMYAPTGVGVLYGKKALLEKMPPWQGGGDMISYVSFEKTLYNVLPYKFEAGTPNIADVIAYGAAISYIQKLGVANIAAHEHELLEYATARLNELPQVRVVGTAAHKASVLSFVLEGAHPHDIGTIMDREGIAIRTGHHCAQPVMDRYGVPATARASFGLYNTRDEVDVFIKGISKVLEVFA